LVDSAKFSGEVNVTTSWTDYPATSSTPIKAVHVNEVRTAINNVGGTPPGGWTDGPTVSSATPVKAKHLVELHDAIQTLWNARALGLVPNWSSRASPGGSSLGTPATSIKASDINNVRAWFNYWETWGDLRGVHWFDANLSDLPRVGWNVETVIGVSNPDGSYNSGAVSNARTNCINARNYGLVNIVRLDWQPSYAVPTNSGDYSGWIANFNQAVNALKDVATLFIAGNEPTIEPSTGISSSQYANAFNQLYASKVSGTSYLVAGPAPWSAAQSSGETDLQWLANLAPLLVGVDGFAFHTYESVDYGCTDPTTPCTPGGNSCVGGDCGFRRYRDFLLRVAPYWASKPVYLTEFNSHGFQATTTPQNDYPVGLIQACYQEVRNYNTATNSSRSSNPRVLNLCWFVDDWRGDPNWQPYALANTGQIRLAQARSDFKASDTSTGITA
jgi:hypothetical protein